MTGLFHSETVRLGDGDKSVVVEGTLVEGDAAAGMVLTIALNRSFGLSFPIAEVTRIGDGRLRLILDCEDRDGAEFVQALNFEGECLDIGAMEDVG